MTCECGKMKWSAALSSIEATDGRVHRLTPGTCDVERPTSTHGPAEARAAEILSTLAEGLGGDESEEEKGGS